ncbi:hypothetical protein GGH19_000338 [Coemansia sp. RSA 1807]|nr:hypothetical protein GGH19_000338 [Coemansia sp. RSA 1807]
MPNVGLLLINSVTWPFLASFPDNILKRQSMHAETARLLTHIASKHNIAVVIVSQAKSTAQPGTTALPLSTDGSAWSQVSANSLAVRQAPEDHSSLIRYSLSFLFLRMQISYYILADHLIECLATFAVLPGQIILRIVSEKMDTSEEIFRVGPDTDFVRLEAAVGLLGNVLDSVQAMQGVRDEV